MLIDVVPMMSYFSIRIGQHYGDQLIISKN